MVSIHVYHNREGCTLRCTERTSAPLASSGNYLAILHQPMKWAGMLQAMQVPRLTLGHSLSNSSKAKVHVLLRFSAQVCSRPTRQTNFKRHMAEKKKLRFPDVFLAPGNNLVQQLRLPTFANVCKHLKRPTPDPTCWLRSAHFTTVVFNRICVVPVLHQFLKQRQRVGICRHMPLLAL